MQPLPSPSTFDIMTQNPHLFGIFIFAIGACFGSFISVCVWRIPRGEDIIFEPSHCPHCNRSIAFYENIPIIGWLMLRGRCSRCGHPISIRYPFLEALTGTLFLLVWFRVTGQGWPLSVLIAYLFLIVVLVAISFIDIDHLIIPDGIVITGAFVAVILGLGFPATHLYALPDQDFFWMIQHHQITFGFINILSDRFPALLHSPRLFVLLDMSLGTIFGAGILWLIAETGKRLLGRKVIRLDAPLPLTLTPDGFQVAEEPLIPWEDLLARDQDRLRIVGRILRLEQKGERRDRPPKHPADWDERDYTIVADIHGLHIEDQDIAPEKLRILVISSRDWEEPREAMGFGDVKLMAMLGAFLGPGAVLFIFFLSCILGATIGLLICALASLFTSKRLNTQIPFGPYIAAAAIIHLLQGPEIISKYWQFMRSFSSF